MAAETKITWTDSTFNLAWGCVKVSEGCAHCYADSLSHRYGFDVWGKNKQRRVFGAKHWAEPIKWNAAAAKAGKRHRVFCSSMCDVFENHPIIDAERGRLWPLIRATPWLDWQLLTKRPERIFSQLPADWGGGWPNVWLGTSIESDTYAQRATYLRAIPAVVRFISYEPALGPLDRVDLTGIDWVIMGGESGGGFRPMEIQWARDIKDRCEAGGTAFFFKQSAGFRAGTGESLGGKIVRNYPVVRLPVLVGL